VILAVLFGVGIFIADSPAVAVASMRRGNYIPSLNSGSGSDGHGLLAGIEMRCAFDDIPTQELENLLLEEANLINGAKPVLRLFQSEKVILN
jgi:hypothetical protein